MKKILSLALISSLYAQSLDSLLNKIEKNNDLSLKTKQESAGISYVITRYQLDMMQAKTLGDVLKNTVISNYQNRYNLLDPFSLPMSPFGNNNIKIFIDNYEINSMSSENSSALFTDLPLDFVDHIEIYYFASADKYFSEPTYAVIKLYSKSPKRDNGLTTNITESRKTDTQTIGYGGYKTSRYYIYSARNIQKNQDYMIDDKQVHKNSKTYHFFTKFRKGENKFFFNTIIDKRDGFLGMSADGKPDTSYITNKQFLVGYNRKFENFIINYTTTFQENSDNFAENDKALYKKDGKDIYSMYTKGDNISNSLKANYKIIQNHKTDIEVGTVIKNQKNFNIDYRINDEQDFNGIRNQTQYTAFINNTYQYLKNSILNTSLSYSYYDNDVVYDYQLTNFKIGNTYLLDERNILKLFYFHTENTPPNYLVNSIFQNSTLKPTTTNSYIMKYKKIANNYNFNITYVTGNSRNQIIHKNNGLENQKGEMSLNFIDFRVNKNYNYINNLTIELYLTFIKNSQFKKQHQISILNTHRFNKFSFFENIIYKYIYTNHANKGLDLDLGMKYNATENLTFAIKANSILNTRYENEYMRYDVDTDKQLEPFKLASTPRNFLFNVEYSF